MPFLGVLEPKKTHRVPGTIVLDEQEAHSEALTRNLKHGTGKYSHILLSPQPSNDPNDPLNWPQSKKILCVAIVFLGSALYGGIVGPLLNTSLFVISAQFNTTITAVVLVSGYQLLVVGCCGPIVSALARKYGKRPLMLCSGLLCIVGSIIGSCSTNVNIITAARIVQGFGVPAYESLLFPFIGDLFFVHERGPYVAVGNFVLAGVANLCGLVTGAIVTNLGWKYLFHLFIACAGVQFVAQLLFVPETSFKRNTDSSHIAEIAVDVLDAVVEAGEKGSVTDSAQCEEAARIQTSNSSIATRKTWFQEMAIFTGKHSDESLLQLIIAPFAVVLNLAALWFTVLPGLYIVFYVAIAFVLPQIFQAPPYLLEPSGVGLLSLGSFTGGIVGSIILGFINDPLIRWATRRNNGIYEPEYRLLPAMFGLCCGAGLIGFGAASQSFQSPYIIAVTYGITLFGIMMTLIPSAGYVIDAYPDLTHEASIINMTFKNILIYGFSYFVTDWTASAGPATVFYILGGIAFVSILSVPLLFIFGKRYRSHWHSHNLLEKLHITTHAEI